MPRRRNEPSAADAAADERGTAELRTLDALAVFEVVTLDQEVDADGQVGGLVLTLASVELPTNERPKLGLSFPPGAYRLIVEGAGGLNLDTGHRLALRMPLTVLPAPPTAEEVLPSEP